MYIQEYDCGRPSFPVLYFGIRDLALCTDFISAVGKCCGDSAGSAEYSAITRGTPSRTICGWVGGFQSYIHTYIHSFIVQFIHTYMYYILGNEDLCVGDSFLRGHRGG